MLQYQTDSRYVTILCLFLFIVVSEMGFGAGISNVCRGKPANQSVLLIKYKATLSGLQEAERLHKHFDGSNHGRQELLRITANKSSSGWQQHSDPRQELQ